MNLDFDYKIFDLENYLTKDEFSDLEKKINGFDVDLTKIKSTLGFLSWSKNVQNKLKEKDINRFNTIIENDYITYDDFKILDELNNEYEFYDQDYFNFFLTYSNSTFKDGGIYEFIKKVFIGIFTILFFLNSDRDISQGSLLKLYIKDGIIDFVPDFKKCVLIEHQNNNYVHEVTHNLVDDVRYSIYSPFTIKDYNEKLESI